MILNHNYVCRRDLQHERNLDFNWIQQVAEKSKLRRMHMAFVSGVF